MEALQPLTILSTVAAVLVARGLVLVPLAARAAHLISVAAAAQAAAVTSAVALTTLAAQADIAASLKAVRHRLRQRALWEEAAPLALLDSAVVVEVEAVLLRRRQGQEAPAASAAGVAEAAEPRLLAAA